MGSTLDSFPRKGCYLFCFVHIVLLISLEIMRKNYISRFILQGHNIIFKNILHVRCSLRKIIWHFMRIFGSQCCGNAVTKAKGCSWLRKQNGPGGASGKALRYGLDGPGSIPGAGGMEIFLHSFVSRLVLGSTQPPIKSVPGNFSGVKAAERRTSHPTSS